MGSDRDSEGASPDLDALRQEFDRALAAAGDARALAVVRNDWIAKKGGRLTRELARLRELPAEERRRHGEAVNRLKAHVEAGLLARTAEIEARAVEQRLAAEATDPTLPGRSPDRGGLHPIQLVQAEVEAVFTGLGYRIMLGPDVEDDYHNFEALNIPADHPARDGHDTFYLDGGALLRTHTSPVQVRTMLAEKPPLRILCPGKVYRRDADASHSPMFHQFEGLVVGEDVSFGDLKGTLEHAFRSLLGPAVELRLRPSFFPFTEPSAEVDISCVLCGARGCPACKGSGWLEVMGAGMVHPAVFEAVGLDPERWTGFAFGGGIDRIAMLRFGVPHIQTFFENDIRVLRQFR